MRMKVRFLLGILLVLHGVLDAMPQAFCGDHSAPCETLEECNQLLLELDAAKVRLMGGTGLSEVIPDVLSINDAKAACAARGLEVPEIWELALELNPGGISNEPLAGSRPVGVPNGEFFYAASLFDPILYAGPRFRLWSITAHDKMPGDFFQLDSLNGELIGASYFPLADITRGVRCRLKQETPMGSLKCSSQVDCRTQSSRVYRRIEEITGVPRLTGALFYEVRSQKDAKEACMSLGLSLPSIQQLASGLDPAGTRDLPLDGFRRIEPAGEKAFYYRDGPLVSVEIPQRVELVWSSSLQSSSPYLGYVFGWTFGVFVLNTESWQQDAVVRCLR